MAADIRVGFDKVRREESPFETVEEVVAGRSLLDRNYEWYIVLTNAGSSPARNVNLMLEPAANVKGDPLAAIEPKIDFLDGNGARASFKVVPRRSTADRITLTVTWVESHARKRRYFHLEILRPEKDLRISGSPGRF